MDICSSKVQENDFYFWFQIHAHVDNDTKKCFEICHEYVSSHHPDPAVVL
jgi:hypothetical protein